MAHVTSTRADAPLAATPATPPLATTSPRGLVFSTPGSRMKVSGDPGTAAFLFGDVTARLPNGQPWGPIEFGTFSDSRFFATMDSPSPMYVSWCRAPPGPPP